MAKARQVGKVLVASGDREFVPRLHPELGGVEPPGVLLRVAALVPAARDALPEDEYEARIADYQCRVAAKLPTPLFGIERPAEPAVEPNDRRELQCWACGVVVLRYGHQKARPIETLSDEARRERSKHLAEGLDGRRWASREVPGCTACELYCPDCFEVWGWPDEYAAEVERIEQERAGRAGEAGRGERLADAGDADGGEPAAVRARGGAGGGGEAVGV